MFFSVTPLRWKLPQGHLQVSPAMRFVLQFVPGSPRLRGYSQSQRRAEIIVR